jgi:type II secretory pathway component PulM
MYGAMAGLTCAMSTALALQLGGWLYQVNPRLLVVMIAIALIPISIWIIWKPPFPNISRIKQIFRRKK